MKTVKINYDIEIRLKTNLVRESGKLFSLLMDFDYTLPNRFVYTLKIHIHIHVYSNKNTICLLFLCLFIYISDLTYKDISLRQKAFVKLEQLFLLNSITKSHKINFKPLTYCFLDGCKA